MSIDTVDTALSNALVAELDKEPPAAEGEVIAATRCQPASLPWPGLADSFELRGAESYWWSVPPATTGFRRAPFLVADSDALRWPVRWLELRVC